MKLSKTHWILAAIFGASVLFGTGVVLYAADSTGHMGDHHDRGHFLADTRLGHFLSHRAGRFHDLQAELSLSDEQKNAFHHALTEHRDQIASCIKPVAECKRALRDAVLADSTDETAIRSAADKLGKALGDAAVDMAKIKNDVKAQVKLTPEQEAILKKFRSERDGDIDSLMNPAR